VHAVLIVFNAVEAAARLAIVNDERPVIKLADSLLAILIAARWTLHRAT
jgi:hypothetical protein